MPNKATCDSVSPLSSRRQRAKPLWRTNNASMSRRLRDLNSRSSKQTVGDLVYIRPLSRIGGHHAAIFLLCQANIYSTNTCRSHAATASIRARRRRFSHQYTRNTSGQRTPRSISLLGRPYSLKTSSGPSTMPLSLPPALTTTSMAATTHCSLGPKLQCQHSDTRNSPKFTAAYAAD
jgi:hypothetical protein